VRVKKIRTKQVLLPVKLQLQHSLLRMSGHSRKKDCLKNGKTSSKTAVWFDVISKKRPMFAENGRKCAKLIYAWEHSSSFVKLSKVVPANLKFAPLWPKG